jgi:hypothetical protein
MKNILAENMLRFGAKNLTESSKRILEQLSEAPEVAAAKPKKPVANKTILGIGKSPNLQSATEVGAFLKGQYGILLDKHYVATDIAIIPNIFGTTMSLFAYSKLNLSRGQHPPREKEGATNTDTSGGALTNNDSVSQGITTPDDKYMLGNPVSTKAMLYQVQGKLESLTGNQIEIYAAVSDLSGTDVANIAANLMVKYGQTALSNYSDDLAKETDRIMNILVQVPGLVKNPIWDQNAIAKVLDNFSSNKLITKWANSKGLQAYKAYHKIG